MTQQERQLRAEVRKLRKFAQELIDHLDYCGWGDTWERECSEKLRKKARAFEDNSPGRKK